MSPRTARTAPALLAFLLVTGPLACGGTGGGPPADDETDRFDSAWTDLTSYLQTEHPDVDLALRPGATDEAILQFEAKIERELPGEIRELYRRADGQEAQGFSLFPSYRFTPLEEAVAQWEVMRSPILLLLSLLPTAEPDPGVRNRWYHPSWIPIGENGAGDMFCVDLAPAAGGTRGQLVEFFHDDTPRRRIAPGLTEYLVRLRRSLEDGSTVPYHEWKTFLPKEQVPSSG